MLYLFLKFAHLTAATFFIGGVFFEVMILSRATRELADEAKAGFSRALGQRARQVMHWVIMALMRPAWAWPGTIARHCMRRWPAASASFSA